MKRSFTRRERVALYLAADGRCAVCGARLGPGWHADHTHPYARGGTTDVVNGQALCPTCNLRKGDRVAEEQWGSGVRWPGQGKPRDWQQDFWRALRQLPEGRQDFLLEACPGAGKTKAALAAAKLWLDEGYIKRLLVVCPSVHLKKQWAKAAAEFGIYLNYRFDADNGQEADDEHGIVATYPQVSRYPLTFRRQCRIDTLGLLDEIHHAGVEPLEGGVRRNLPWAAGLVEAVGAAKFNLSTTATPFRTDGFELPFVSYKRENGVGRTLPDYRYSYERALEDHVCRPIFFPEYEGKVAWEKGGEIHEGLLTDDCPNAEEAIRLRMAVNEGGPWIKRVLGDANDQLLSLRRSGDRRAAGLVLALGVDHARALAGLLQTSTGIMPKIAVSDEAGASDVIEAFEKSDDPWLVSVRMVSEGVDIKRLRVGVYASNWLTWLYFLQVCGRFWRWDDRLARGQAAYLYMPATKTLVDYAARIVEIREHYLSRQRREAQQGDGETGERKPAERATFVRSDEGRLVRVHVNGHEYPPAEVRRAQEHVRRLFDDPEATVPEPNLERVILYLREVEGPLEEDDVADAPDLTAEKRALSKRLSKMVWEYACRLAPDGTPEDTPATNKERRRLAAEADRELRLQTDGKPNLATTVAILKRRIKDMGLRLGGMADAGDDSQR